jgi:hypothetical protein
MIMGPRYQGYLEKLEVKYLKIEMVHVTVVIVLRLVPNNVTVEKRNISGV